MQSEVSEQMPEFLNESFFQRAIKSYKSDDTIEIIKFEVNAAFGEHYASKMYRAAIEFKSLKYSQLDNETLTVVIKAKPIGDPHLEAVVAGGPLFETEIETYQTVIPAMHRLYKGYGYDVQFAPELIYVTDQPYEIIVIKDLTPENYSVFREPPENIEDSKKFVKGIAQFHAASIMLQESNEIDFTQFNYSIYQSENILDFFFRDTIKAFIEVVREWDGYESFIPKLEKLILDIGEIGKKSYTPNRKGCGFNVLNHGDLHLRNILIKANTERKIESFYFVDYQLSVWCSPVVDLSYMMGIVKFDNTNDTIQEELIVFYHQELVNALKSIGYMRNPPSLVDINVELLKHGAMNIAIWINFFPFMFIDWETMSADDMMGTDTEKSRKFKKNLYNSPVLRAHLQREMKSWMYKGWW